ncbi:DUF4258 domain-containing protein [bacterium]|nr:DUF4258 domain-containing protein [bacterium]
MPVNLELISRCALADSFEIARHANRERLEEGISYWDMVDVLCSAELLEDYPDDPRGHSCLLLGFAQERAVHVVCGLRNPQRPVIITVYCPTLPKWMDERRRGDG